MELIDLLRHTASEDAPVSAVMLETVVLPTTMPRPVALARMQRTRNELACLVDEYGNFDGILTIEDLTEEVVGELSDEHDTDLDEAVALGETSWSLPGDMHLDEVERLIGHDLPDHDSETIAGLAVSPHGDLVPVGGRVRIELADRPSESIQGIRIEGWLEVRVTEVDRHVPAQLSVQLHERDRMHLRASPSCIW